MRGRTLIWAMQNEDWVGRFDRVLRLEAGKLVGDEAGARRAAEAAELQTVATS
jgi:hypothetical protein